MTAGDVIRAELARGASELGLAKKLAGVASADHPEVKRWRYVVRRAARGGEPEQPNAEKIAAAFGRRVSAPDRRPGRPPGIQRRLEELADRLASAMEQQETMSRQIRALQARVRTLEAERGRSAAAAMDQGK